ncbi:hypothetical protein [Caldalkalibacillus thermarum]|nr:hypothetical protein [Caldalkalibacillus thermarum]
MNQLSEQARTKLHKLVAEWRQKYAAELIRNKKSKERVAAGQ